MNETSEESLPDARVLTRRGALALGAASAATLMLRPLAFTAARTCSTLDWPVR